MYFSVWGSERLERMYARLPASFRILMESLRQDPIQGFGCMMTAITVAHIVCSKYR
jgi:hypothetical protein